MHVCFSSINMCIFFMEFFDKKIFLRWRNRTYVWWLHCYTRTVVVITCSYFLTTISIHRYVTRILKILAVTFVLCILLIFDYFNFVFLLQNCIRIIVCAVWRAILPSCSTLFRSRVQNITNSFVKLKKKPWLLQRRT